MTERRPPVSGRMNPRRSRAAAELHSLTLEWNPVPAVCKVLCEGPMTAWTVAWVSRIGWGMGSDLTETVGHRDYRVRVDGCSSNCRGCRKLNARKYHERLHVD